MCVMCSGTVWSEYYNNVVHQNRIFLEVPLLWWMTDLEFRSHFQINETPELGGFDVLPLNLRNLPKREYVKSL